jgi:hypothetical protein
MIVSFDTIKDTATLAMVLNVFQFPKRVIAKLLRQHSVESLNLIL